jgi:hypothetical protein
MEGYPASAAEGYEFEPPSQRTWDDDDGRIRRIRRPKTSRRKPHERSGRRTKDQTGRTQRQQSAVGKATQELQEVLRSETAKPEQIKAKLTALRTAKAKAKKDLAIAQNELKKDLTVKQVAILVLSGYLN